MAHRYRIDFAAFQALQPWGAGAGDAGSDDAGDMPVDVVAGQRRTGFVQRADFAIRQQSGFDQRLEAVADA